MKVLKLALFASVLSLQLLSVRDAAAGPSNGGGGDAQVCFIDKASADVVRAAGHQISDALLPKIKSIAAVDYLEAIVPQGMNSTVPKLIPLTAGMKVSDYLEKVAARFDHYVPKLSHFIRDGEAAFGGGNTRYEEDPIPYINDADLPMNLDHDDCTLATLARQDEEGGTSILRVDNRLYSHAAHPLLSRAILLLHELIYRAARLSTPPHTNSEPTRLLVGAMLDESDVKTVWSMIQFAADEGFMKADVSETYLDQFRAKIGLMALQQGWKYYQEYSAQNPGQQIQGTDVLGGGTEGQGSQTLYTNPFDGNPAFFISPDSCIGCAVLPTLSSMPDNYKAKIAQLTTQFMTYSQARAQYVSSQMQAYAKTVLVPYVQKEISGVPANDKDVLVTDASTVFSPVAYYANEYLLCVNPKDTTDARSTGLLHFLNGSDYDSKPELGLATFGMGNDPLTCSIVAAGNVGADSTFLSRNQDPSSTPDSLVIGTSKVGGEVTCDDTFDDPAAEFTYPIP